MALRNYRTINPRDPVLLPWTAMEIFHGNYLVIPKLKLEGNFPSVKFAVMLWTERTDERTDHVVEQLRQLR